MSRRRLTEDEHTLWRGVTRSIDPIRKRRSATTADVVKDDPKPASSAAPRASRKLSPPPTPAPAKPIRSVAIPPPLAPLDRKARKRLAHGRQAIDGRLDLHGLTQDEAHGVLFAFLRARQSRGARVVLVITGKGGSAEGRGILKRMVPLWLSRPEFRDLIIGFEDAAVGHGGTGALYVSLRRIRS